LGTEDALHTTTKYMNKALDDAGKKPFDLAKAFDTVSHVELGILPNFGIKNFSIWLINMFFLGIFNFGWF